MAAQKSPRYAAEVDFVSVQTGSELVRAAEVVKVIVAAAEQIRRG